MNGTSPRASGARRRDFLHGPLIGDPLPRPPVLRLAMSAQLGAGDEGGVTVDRGFDEVLETIGEKSTVSTEK